GRRNIHTATQRHRLESSLSLQTPDAATHSAFAAAAPEDSDRADSPPTSPSPRCADKLNLQSSPRETASHPPSSQRQSGCPRPLYEAGYSAPSARHTSAD